MKKRFYHSEETKKKLRQANLGKCLSEETKRKISEANKGKLGYWKGRCFSERHKRKIGEACKGRHRLEETKQRMKKASNSGKWNKGCIPWNKGKHPSEETRKKLSENQKGRRSLDHSKRMRGKNNPFYGLHHSKEVRQKIRQGVIEFLRSGKSQHKPTIPEKKLNNLLHFLFPNEYKYVGNFKFWVDGKNPDFVNVNGQKKIIEMFGNYWHKKEEELNRINHFRKFGFDTLIVWEKEIKNLLPLVIKLKKFHQSQQFNKI